MIHHIVIIQRKMNHFPVRVGRRNPSASWNLLSLLLMTVDMSLNQMKRGIRLMAAELDFIHVLPNKPKEDGNNQPTSFSSSFDHLTLDHSCMKAN